MRRRIFHHQDTKGAKKSVAQSRDRARRDAKVTMRLNKLFACPALSDSQRREAEEWDRVATPWADERW
jgi:hypothetical protein